MVMLGSSRGSSDDNDHLGTQRLIMFEDRISESHGLTCARLSPLQIRYLNHKWGCDERESPYFDIYHCRFQHPFNRTDLRLWDWTLDPTRRECIMNGKVDEICWYDDAVVSRGPGREGRVGVWP
jgi:hypothetical protein